jgi:putative ABC transport system permease protein
MINTYFKLGLRNIWRKKVYTTINLIGLSVASALCILIYWYGRYEQSFDSFHVNGKQLYRLEFNDIFGGDNKEKETKKDFFSFLVPSTDKNLVVTPVILAAELKKNFPEIENTVRIVRGDAIVFVNNHGFKEKNNVAFVDPSFFKVFSFSLKEGNASTILSSINNVVITEKLALKYFGKESAVGKTIKVSTLNNNLFTVSGVVNDFPANSSLQFSLLFPREADTWYKDNEEHGLNSFSDILILQLKQVTNIPAFNQKLDIFGKKYFQPTLQQWASFPGSNTKPENFHIILRPFADAHYNASEPWMHYTDLKSIYQLSAVAIIILLIACLNYILLTLTGTVSRSQEVGIRKTVGAERKQIVLQFFIETQLLALIAVFIGFLLSVICLPLFNYLIGIQLQIAHFSFKDVILPILILSFALGIIGGIYPSLVMSGLKPLNMMRNFSAYRLKPYLSRILVVTQFSVCIILIISSLVISKQIRYTNTKDLGFDKDQIIAVQNPYGFNEREKAFQLRERLFHYASGETVIENITSTSFPYKGHNTNNHTINNERVEVQDFNVDYNYFSFFKIPIIKGRSFSSAIAEDTAILQLTDDQKMATGSAARQSVVVNETLYKMLGYPPIDTINRALGARIIGVCKDYYADDLTKKIAPGYHRVEKGFIGYFWLKIKAGQNIPQTLKKITDNWNMLTANQPFSYSFLDEDVAKSYDAYLRWMKTITVSSVLAIIIACMGLFGLSGLTTVNRVKEIGIRKVLGATVEELFILLNKSTFLMALISFIIAVPIAVYLSNSWLQNFAYRIQLDWPLFAFAGIISLITALIAVSYHTIKTAKANPVKSLKTE